MARLLSPGKRRRAEANARLRALWIVDGAMQGEKLQPSEATLQRLSAQIGGGTTQLEVLFPGIAAVAFSTEGSGPTSICELSRRKVFRWRWSPRGPPILAW